MTQIIDFYFDVGSPASYLAWTQLPALALCEDPSVKAELKRLTEEAVRRGIFGAPIFSLVTKCSSDKIECRSWKITFQSAGEQKFERLFGHL